MERLRAADGFMQGDEHACSSHSRRPDAPGVSQRNAGHRVEASLIDISLTALCCVLSSLHGCAVCWSPLEGPPRMMHPLNECRRSDNLLGSACEGRWVQQSSSICLQAGQKHVLWSGSLVQTMIVLFRWPGPHNLLPLCLQTADTLQVFTWTIGSQ
jgi:hypothetical protein